MATAEADVAAKLIERLLVDPAFRARFRRNPAAACREAGLESLAQEMQIGAGKAMMTLDLRESKSSLAGVMMAAAMEGVGVMQFAQHVAPHLDDIPEAVGDVLSRINLPAVGLPGGGAKPSAPVLPPENGGADGNGAGGGGAAAAAPEAPAAAPEEAATAPPEAAAAADGASPEEAAAEDPKAAGKAAAAKIKAAESPEAQAAKKAQEASAEIAEDAEDLPGATDMPDATAEPQASVDVGGDPNAAAPAAPPAATPEQVAAAPAPAAPAASPEQAAAAPAPPAAPVDPAAPPAPADPAAETGADQVEARGQRRAIDPSEFGQDGKGGSLSPEGAALLKNKNLEFDSVGIADLKAGKIDPRVVAALTKLSEDHEIKVSCMCSDHSKFTSGGSISNHAYGRGLDIASVDGEIVNPGSAAARELATELSTLDERYRPNEIGSPWPISGPGYFTDAGHQDHVHLGFKDEIPKDWTVPSELTGDRSGAAAAAVPGAPAAAAVPGAPEVVAAAVPGAPAPAAAPVAAAAAAPKAGDSGQFMAAKATAAGAKKGDSGQFMAAAQPPPAQAATAPPAGVADAAAAAVDLSGVGGYPGDDAPKEQLAAWLGKEAEKRGLPPELPVMASLVESGVKNLNFGDADSVGFFQMRVGIWNQGAYEGFPEKPELQAKWFLDTAEQVKKQRIARGQPIDDPSSYGEWIADVERPAAQYRGRYQLRLEEAKGLLAKGAGAPAVPAVDPAGAGAAPATPAPAPPAAVEPAGVAADVAGAAAGGGAGPKAMAALAEAQKYTGTDYKWGGSTPQTGFDCSGLVQWAYAKAGVQIPRVTDAQFAAGNGTSVERGALKPGDLVFFGKPGNIYHVGISMGGDKFLHAPKTGDVVKVSDLSESYYSENFAGGRRFDDASGAASAVAAPAAPAAAAAAAVPAAPAIDPAAVAKAQAAVARDAAEVKRTNSGLFMAVKAQEERRHKTVQFMKAIDPDEAKAAAAPPAAAAPAAPAAPADAAAAPAPAPPAAVEPSGTPVDAGEPIQLPDDISDDYPGNNASKDELATWLAKQADKHGLPPELPVMAALVESGVKNLNFGDADSVGFFQMRVGIWNQGAYKGYPEHPELQAKWFIDQALAVKKQAIARGDADFGKDPSKWGEWIADIERPAEQYRGRYQLRLKEARGLLS